MDKDEALRQISLTMEQVKCMPSFDGKAKMLKQMGKAKDYVVIHKPFVNYYELCARAVQAMFDQKRSQLEAIKEARS